MRCLHIITYASFVATAVTVTVLAKNTAFISNNKKFNRMVRLKATKQPQKHGKITTD
jgi:hypothetical protein